MSFENILRSCGLRPRTVIADGKWRRCTTDDKPTKKNGAYVLHPDGRGYWRNWATDLELNKWTDESLQLAARVDPAIIERQRQQERRKRLAGIERARKLWHAGQPMRGLHPYLAGKGLSVQGLRELRVLGNRLLVPVWWGASLINVQTIDPAGVKLFQKDAPTAGGAFAMDRPGAAVTVYAEGLATGAAVYQCMRQVRVVVVFNAGNFMPVVQRTKPTGSVVIAADNDHETMRKRGFNPGIQAANNVAELIGCGVAFPEGIEGSDWADALKEWGQQSARKIERQILAQARYVTRASA